MITMTRRHSLLIAAGITAVAGLGGNARAAGGKFDAILKIDEHGCITPAGPLELQSGETVLRLDVWVFQSGADGKSDGVGAACMATQTKFPNRTRWTTNPDPHRDHHGDRFRPGVANAMALMVSRRATGECFVTQWTMPVALT